MFHINGLYHFDKVHCLNVFLVITLNLFLGLHFRTQRTKWWPHQALGVSGTLSLGFKWFGLLQRIKAVQLMGKALLSPRLSISEVVQLSHIRGLWSAAISVTLATSHGTSRFCGISSGIFSLARQRGLSAAFPSCKAVQ